MIIQKHQKEANLGNSAAQFNIACIYEGGEGIIENIDQAIYWYKKSAEQGNKGAQYKIKNFIN